MVDGVQPVGLEVPMMCDFFSRDQVILRSLLPVFSRLFHQPLNPCSQCFYDVLGVDQGDP